MSDEIIQDNKIRKAYFLSYVNHNVIYIVMDLGTGCMAEKYVKLRGVYAGVDESKRMKEFFDEEWEEKEIQVRIADKPEHQAYYMVDVFTVEDGRLVLLNEKLIKENIAKAWRTNNA